MPEPAPEHPRRAAWIEWAAAAALVAIVVVVYRGALDYFFAQDDFAGLARARGLIPRLEGPWRWLSGQGYFDVMRALSGLDPRGYRAVSLSAHAVTTLLAYALLRRRAAVPAAWLGAAFYAAHPAHFTALYSVSGIGELLSPLLGLAAVLALDASGTRRLLAPVAFAASLACKETTLLVPLVALLRPRPAGTDAGRAGVRHDLRAPAWWAMTVLAAAYAVTFLARDTFAIRSGLEASAAYAVRFDGTLLSNGLTYLGWTSNALLATTRSFADAVDLSLWPWAWATLTVLLSGLFSRGLRERGWTFGVAWFVATLLPVLPLANHTYHYYLVAPLLGVAVCVAAAADWVLQRSRVRAAPPARAAGAGGRGGAKPRRGGARAPAATQRSSAVGDFAATTVLLLGLAWAVNGAMLVRKNETYPFTDPELRSDATVDRARIARNVHHDLAGAHFPPGTTLRFWSPSSIQRGGEGREGETYWERNVRHALLDGLGVRVLFPAVTRVEFVRAFDPAADSTRWAVYLPNGHLRVATTPELATAIQDFERSH